MKLSSQLTNEAMRQSLSSRRAWIEIRPSDWRGWRPTSRSPHGERGLKFVRVVEGDGNIRSLSSRRAWIEIYYGIGLMQALNRRSPHGERGLKFEECAIGSREPCRSPHGERGLKCLRHASRNVHGRSLSSRRAWIEINTPYDAHIALPSLSSRRAWIEISLICGRMITWQVALLTESVD